MNLTILPAVIVVSYALPSKLKIVLTRLKVLSNLQAEVVLLCTAGICSTLNERLANLDISENIRIHITPTRVSIGEARSIGIHLVQSPYIAFLDDDCIPHDSWWNALVTACNHPMQPALIFGSREPDKGEGIGTLVRQIEAKKSRKFLHQGAEPVTVEFTSSQNYICAGGNMAIRCSVVATVPITAEKFRACAFEDVDFQLRLMKRGELVMFNPSMRVSHLHPLNFFELLNKSKLSGIGIALCLNTHNKFFKQLSRWSPQMLLDSVLWRIAWIPLVIIFPWFLMLFVPVFFAIIQMSKGYGVTGFFAWWLIKGIRDFVIIF
jgi:GT2 family glycosyltransferase